jgi:hypothetical protein
MMQMNSHDFQDFEEFCDHNMDIENDEERIDEDFMLNDEEERIYSQLEDLLLSNGLNPDFGRICEDNKSSRFKIKTFNSEEDEIADIYRTVIVHETRRGKNCHCLMNNASAKNNVSQTTESMPPLVDLIMYTRNYIRSMRESPDNVLRCTLKGKLNHFADNDILILKF